MNKLTARAALMVTLVIGFVAAPLDSDAYAQRRSSRAQSNTFIVENDALVEVTLNRALNTKTVRDGERFTAAVTGPSQYRGATIEGRVADSKRSGQVRGNAEMTLEFDRIKLRNGRIYRFAGTVERVKTPNGAEVEVDDEGEISREDSQTDRTVKRTGLGAIAGAVIGGIAGGGDGAVAGAVIGGGAGAGSVALQDKRDVNLARGTRMVIRASAPR